MQTTYQTSLSCRAFEYALTTRLPSETTGSRRQSPSSPRSPKIGELRKDLCLHAHGTYKARGKGRRNMIDCNAQSSMIDCNAQINACVQAVAYTNPPVFKLRITSCWTAYEPDVAANLTFLTKAGAKKKRIIQFIHENSKCKPIAHDIHNFVLRLKKQGHTAPTSAKRMKLWMKNLRRSLEMLEEICRHCERQGANPSKYKIFSTMAHDSFGKGQFVQHAVVQNERNPTLLTSNFCRHSERQGANPSKYKIFRLWHMKGQFVQHALVQNERNPTLLTSLEEFKRNNPAWTRIKCILIDKDFGEISVLTTAFLRP
ncbi:hypothetical protein PHMEG_0009368 [Phytophthora megakarya]|uniref:ZSWIM1/3 RNaseH-like domain-containing protein n=1 Tax=Phytophthora megakarya TaxID=4795 RepID=A0A225WI57_9STRA|nr:hypothetical protein PHMEG_0009368 [Phytophthora megakarya]